MRFSNKIFINSFLILALSIIYYPLLVSDPLTNRDDLEIVLPLKKVTSLAHYFEMLKTHQVLDIQPIRDLTYLFDWWCKLHLNINTFHLTNFVTWLLILWIVQKILLLLFKANSNRFWSVFIAWTFHPVFSNSVSWVSARKHLLSCLFILLATHIFLKSTLYKSKKYRFYNSFFMTFNYFLSVFSHPINILWPIWAWIYHSVHQKSIRFDLLSCLPILLICGYLNYKYYNGPFTLFAENKFQEINFNHLSVSLLSLGRYLFQLCFPFFISTEYSVGSIQNLIGLCLFPLLLILILKHRNQKILFCWILFLLLPLCAVTVRMTNIFVSDSYLLTGMWGAFFALVYIGQNLRWKNSYNFILVLFGITFFLKSFEHARTWISNKHLWQNAYVTEKTSKSIALYGMALLDEGNSSEANKLINEITPFDLNEPSIPVFYSRFIYQNKDYSISQKIKFLNALNSESYWKKYYLAVLYLRASKINESYRFFLEAIPGARRSYGADYEIICAEAYYLCKKTNSQNCDQLLKQMQSRVIVTTWDQEKFLSRIQQLKLTLP